MARDNIPELKSVDETTCATVDPEILEKLKQNKEGVGFVIVLCTIIAAFFGMLALITPYAYYNGQISPAKVTSMRYQYLLFADVHFVYTKDDGSIDTNSVTLFLATGLRQGQSIEISRLKSPPLTVIRGYLFEQTAGTTGLAILGLAVLILSIVKRQRWQKELQELGMGKRKRK